MADDAAGAGPGPGPAGTADPGAGGISDAAAGAQGAGDPAAAAAAGDAGAGSAGAEAYTFTAPDGMDLDATAVEQFTAIAKARGLDQAAAQEIADIAVGMRQRDAEAHARQVEQWGRDVVADPEIGGDKYEENLAIARNAIEQFGGPELKAELDRTGYGNHPLIVKFALRAGKAILDDSFAAGKGGGGQARDPALLMYPTMN